MVVALSGDDVKQVTFQTAVRNQYQIHQKSIYQQRI
jgi:hypothetical protein